MNSRTGLLILRIALGVVVGVNSAALVVSQVRGFLVVYAAAANAVVAGDRRS